MPLCSLVRSCRAAAAANNEPPLRSEATERVSFVIRRDFRH
jgi:hypothetical protein